MNNMTFACISSFDVDAELACIRRSVYASSHKLRDRIRSLKSSIPYLELLHIYIHRQMCRSHLIIPTDAHNSAHHALISQTPKTPNTLSTHDADYQKPSFYSYRSIAPSSPSSASMASSSSHIWLSPSSISESP